MADRFENRGRWRRRYDEDEGTYDRDYDRRTYGQRRDYAAYENDWDEGYFDREPTWSYTEIWWVPGPATGLGPRGYQRSDERIEEEVCERLTWHGRINASNIEVEVKDGEVTLSGTVPDRRTKRLAEDVAESVAGVADVHNRLHLGSIGWPEGQASHREKESEGWPEGQAAHTDQDSIGWPEGQASHRDDESVGWAEGQAEEDRTEEQGWSESRTIR